MRGLWKLMEQPVTRLLGLDAVNDIYLRTLADDRCGQSGHGDGGGSYFSVVLDAMKLGYDVSDEDRLKIPTEGPVIVVANHPFGAAEGVVMGDLLTRVRKDARLLGNHLLHRVPELRPFIVAVDPFGGSDAVYNNVGSLQDSRCAGSRTGARWGPFPPVRSRTCGCARRACHRSTVAGGHRGAGAAKWRHRGPDVLRRAQQRLVSTGRTVARGPAHGADPVRAGQTQPHPCRRCASAGRLDRTSWNATKTTRP